MWEQANQPLKQLENKSQINYDCNQFQFGLIFFFIRSFHRSFDSFHLPINELTAIAEWQRTPNISKNAYLFGYFYGNDIISSII